MNDMFALDPAVAGRISELRLLLSKFGFYEGRFISRFPSGWVKLALDGVTDQNLRQRVHALMERSKKECVFARSNRAYDAVKPWVDNAAEQHAIDPFNGVISTEARPGFMHIDDLDPASFPGSRDARIMGSRENIMKAIRPLLKLSGSLYLIDPYFNPCAASTRSLLKEVLTESFSARCIEFKAFVSKKEWPGGMNATDNQIRDALPKMLAGKGQFRIVVCDDQEEMTSPLHARYLFSEKGGVRLDKGLQTSRSEFDVSFIDQSVHKNLLRTFVERPLPYKVIAEFSCQL